MSPALSVAGCRLERRDGQRRRFTLVLDELPEDHRQPIAVVGPSGSGKSTLLELLTLIRVPDSARHFVIMDRETKRHDIMPLWRTGNDSTLARLRARTFGYAPQRAGYFPSLSARANATFRTCLAGMTGKGMAERVGVLGEALELSPEELGALPTKLSAGQQQRVGLLLAMIHEPQIIVADEPTSALHPTLAATVLKLLLDRARKTSAKLMIATHDVDLARALGFRLLPAKVDEPAANDVLTRFAAA